MTTATMPLVRIARSNGVCGAPGCTRLIYIGAPIIKPTGGAWRHLDCDRPGRRGKPMPDIVNVGRTKPRRTRSW